MCTLKAINLSFLWGGHLARQALAGKMPIPQEQAKSYTSREVTPDKEFIMHR
jgi:hypothetical protein